MNEPLKQKVSEILARADITIDGSRPWDIHVKNDRFYARVLSQGSLGLGESYMDGWWECDQIDELILRITKADLAQYVSNWSGLKMLAKSWLMNQQSRSRAFEIGQRHYDIGNDLYERMLDHRMTYTCAYWKHATTLDQAQEAKLDLVCRKIGLDKQPGMRVLDIGCGWGSFMIYAAQKYQAKVTGITVSKEQMELGKKLAREAGQESRVEFQLKDYRDTTGTYDRVVSLGMIEHVGYKNYHTFMELASRVLTDNGMFLLHTIGGNISEKSGDPWVLKYIFPNSMLPSISQLSKAAEDFFVVEDWHNFGIYYEKTLLTWMENVDRAWPELKEKYGDRFYRMWKFYLLVFSGMFRARHFQLWQIVLSKGGVPGGYESIR